MLLGINSTVTHAITHTYIYISYLIQKDITSLLAEYLHKCHRHERKYGQSDEWHSVLSNK